MTLSRGFEGPRAVAPAEIPRLLALLDRCFSPRLGHGMRTENPHIYGRMEKFCPRHLVVLYRGRIVAHAGVYPLDFVSPDGRVTAGGIGAVCTEAGFRGRGLMADLLGGAARKMEGDGIPLSILWGNRYRYQPFGWEPAGSRYAGTFGGRALPALSRFDFPSSITPLSGRVVGCLYSIHQRMASRIDTDQETFRLKLGRAGRRVWIARDGRAICAYAVVRRHGLAMYGKARRGWAVDGWGGSLEGILSITRALLSRPGTDFVRCLWPAGRARIPAPVLEAADGWYSGVEHMGQIRINDLKSAMSGLSAGGLVSRVRALGWDGRAQARLLFGPASPANLLPPAKASGVLGRSLPLGLFLEPLDGV